MDLSDRSAERVDSPDAVNASTHDPSPRGAGVAALNDLSDGARGARIAAAAALGSGRLLHADAPRDVAEATSIFHDSELAEQERRPLLFAISLLHPFVGATRRSTRFAGADLLPAPGPEMRLYDGAFEGPEGPSHELAPGWDSWAPAPEQESGGRRSLLHDTHVAHPSLLTTICAEHGLRRRLEPVATYDAWRWPPCCASTSDVPHAAEGLGSDLAIDAVRADLAGYHDRALLFWLERGFRTGALDRAGEPAGQFTFWPNHASAREPGTAERVRAAVEAEVAQGWVDRLGVARNAEELRELLVPLGFSWGIVAPLSTVPKGDSIRVIHDMSFPKRRRGRLSRAPASANARVGVNAEMTQPGPRLFRAAVRRLRARWPKQRLRAMKLDVVAAYRRLRYDGSERSLLLFAVGDEIFCYNRPSFGSRASAALFSRVMAALQWALRESVARAAAELRSSDPELADELETFEGMSIIDDSCFITTERAAGKLLELILAQYARWGMPVNAVKQALEGSFHHKIVWAGIEHDLDADTHVLHEAKRVKWAATVRALGIERTCTVADLRTLVGKLSFAAEAQQLGRAFLGHLGSDLRLAEAASRTHVMLSNNSLRELAAWTRLLERAVATPSLTRPIARSVRRYMTDASTSVGLAGAWLEGDTLRLWHYAYTPREIKYIASTSRSTGGAHITRLELLCFLVSARAWGVDADHVEFAGDNSASCAMIGQQGARADKVCTEIILDLAEILTAHRTTVSATWIPGRLNALLDLASREADHRLLARTLTAAFPDLVVQVTPLASSPLRMLAGLAQPPPRGGPSGAR
jgi:hypothetical protein